MKLTPKQRTKIFDLTRLAISNKDKVKVLSSDYPNRTFIYQDNEYEIIYYYNQFGLGITTGDVVQISLLDKKSKEYIKFDSGDYIFMRNRYEMLKLIEDIHKNIFLKDDTDKEDSSLVDKILNIKK